ncbi:MAG: pitrilysin family protein [Candidatus Micrarchaeaceae archaeon]
MRIYKRVLENGLRVVIAPRKSLESVAIIIGVNFGSMDDGARMNGLTHFIEHMLFKGTIKRDWAKINEITRNYNIYYNAETDYETTLYEAVVYKRYLDRAMDLISDMVINPIFDKRELEKERGPILHEIAIRREDPDSILYDNMPRTLFVGDAALAPPNGTALSGRIKRRDLVNAYSKYYNPKNMVLVIYGGVSKDDALALAEKYMSKFKRKYYRPERHELKRRGRTGRNYIRKKDIERGEIGIGIACKGLASGSVDEYVSMEAVAELLNNRVYDNVREEHGLSYDPGVDYESYGTFSYIMASAGAAPAKLGKIRSIILSEMHKISKNGVSTAELEKVKKGLEIRYSMGLDRPLDSATDIAEMELMYGNCRIFERIPKAIKNLEVRSINKLIRSNIDVSKYGEVILERR